MATIRLPADFKEFLRLLTSTGVEYLAISGVNAERLAGVVREFGFAHAEPGNFLDPGKIIRMGVPPVRLEVLTSISGVQFSECYGRRIQAELDGVPVMVIAFEDLKKNKYARGRLKDLLDLEQLG